MNILFLVTSFLLIFSFISASLLKNSLFFSHEKSSYCSYLEGKQKLHDKWERYQYQSYKKNKPPEKKNAQQKTITPKETTYTSHRVRKNLPKLAKWNIAPMLLSEVPCDALETRGAILLEELYGHAPFWLKAKLETPDLAETLIASFKSKKLGKEDLTNLSDLFPQEPLLQNVFYKMLKGTSLYDLEKKKGYPPLSEFFTLDVEEKKTLSFPYASFPAIKAFFGEDVAEEIVLLEKETSQTKGVTYYAASKDELIAITTQKGQGIYFTEIEESLSFAHKKALLEKLTQQEKKGPFLSIPLPQK